MKISNIFRFFNEKVLLTALGSLSSILLLRLEFYPSMDGPSHLYNAVLLRELLFHSNSPLHQYFEINPFPIPNLISSYLLSILLLLFSASVAEKIYLLLYIWGLALAFRYFVAQAAPQNKILSLFIFPFIYSFLFHLGFYNYTFSFIFFYWTLGYWFQNQTSFTVFPRLKHYFILSIFFLATYCSALLTFFFLFLSICCLTAWQIYLITIEKSQIAKISKILSKIGLVFLSALPSWVLSGLFLLQFPARGSSEKLSGTELIKWLNDVRCLISYNYPGEEKLTEQFLHIFIALFAISIYYTHGESYSHSRNQKLGKGLVPALIIALGLYFFVPTGFSVGMMSERLGLMVFMLLLPCVVTMPLPKSVLLISVALFMGFHIALLLSRYNATQKKLSLEASHIAQAQKHLPSYAVVLPINFSDNWIEPHFSNYLGTQKPLIILENYEASTGWFPIRWNYIHLPKFFLGKHEKLENISTWPNGNSLKQKSIDYVFIYGNLSHLQEEKNKTLQEILNKHYRLAYQENQSCEIAIYKRYP
ncbi:MAG: hypothetical protein RML72_11375 [Bacteroidia bacterium]|nr:hypothetical protein [Bacteroidia bacterium]MDW8159456.1 hypothetical protein [Bacteroidia bacterium]